MTALNANTVAQANYTYDAHGNLLSTSVWNGSKFIGQTTNNSYNPNGTVATSYDPANNLTTYTYSASSYIQCSSCTNYPFPTSMSKGGLTTSATWNGTGGVKLTDVDANGNTTTYGYQNSSGVAEPFWRVTSITDPLNNVVWESYPSGSSPDTVSNCFTFNSSNSTQCTTTTSDGYGRRVDVQTRQGPSSSNYDTVSTAYAWSGNYRQIETSQPCSEPLSSPCAAYVHNNYIDPLGRLYQETTTNNETLSHTYTQNDDLSVLSPAPSGENTKQAQNQYDGLGRLQKSCAIGNGSTTPCGQNTGSQNGVTTSYSYTSGTGSTTVTATRGSQSRSTTYDAMGRKISETKPESGTTQYFWDTSAPDCNYGVVGDLSEKKDNAGVVSCYWHDSLHRLVGVAGNHAQNPHPCRIFAYDTPTAATASTPPPGATFANTAGRLVEAWTNSDCNGQTNLLTAEWFSYDKDGNVTDMWEWTPHSGQYYHSVATYYGNGKVNTLQLASPALYTMTYGLDGEGRWNTLTDTTKNQPLVTGASFYPASNPSVISLTGTDNDAYTFDSNTGRMTKFVFTVGSSNMTGNLTWNANGTLNQLAITDGFNPGGTQTCNSNSNSSGALGYGYDDWGRLAEFDCGSGQWGQQFSYDSYDNLSKTVLSGRTGTTWNPGYSTSNNHCNGCSYDANGNVTGDGSHVYGWDAYQKLAWAAPSGTPACGTSGNCITYDAFGRMVEESNGSSWMELWFTPLGQTAWMIGSTSDWANWPAPGTGIVTVGGNSSAFSYVYQDWLNNARVTSDLIAHTIRQDVAYTPYGETYDTFGNGYYEFAGIFETFDPFVMWDTPNRELSHVGRWLSPDPAGAGWNQYAYPTNPNSLVDPTGLFGKKQFINPYFYPQQNVCITTGDGMAITCDNMEEFALEPWLVPAGNAMAVGSVEADATDPNYQLPGWNGGQQQNWTSNDSSDDGPSLINAAYPVGTYPVGTQPPSSSCEIVMRTVCGWFFNGRWWSQNRETDQLIFNMTKDTYLWAMGGTVGVVFGQINGLEQLNLAIDEVGLGYQDISTLDAMPLVPELLPPGIDKAADAGLDFFIEVRNQNNVQIGRLLQSLANIQP